MTPALDEKDNYAELTEKQQQVVDELVETPTAQNQDVADRADVSRSTVYNVKEKYGDIVESQLNQVGRYNGEGTMEGDPFNGKLKAEQSWQSISERPDAQERADENPETEGGVLTVRLHRPDIEQILLTGSISDDFRRDLVNRVLESAFINSEG
jgi:hypothetical protein